MALATDPKAERELSLAKAPVRYEKEQNDLPSMTLMGHLSELRDRLIKALIGVAVAYAISLTFTEPRPDRPVRERSGILAQVKQIMDV